VQVEHIDDVPTPQDGWDDTEQAADQTRDGESNVVVRTGHLACPDLADEGDNQTPQDDRAAPEQRRERGDEERSCDPAGESSGDRVEQVGLSLVVGGYLQDEGELIGIRRHLACETSQTDADEDNNLPAHWPVLPMIEVSAWVLKLLCRGT